MNRTITYKSVITCPSCNSTFTETMPENACRYFWECPNCHREVRPLEGDCCVYCSYGSVPCPPVQQSQSCC